MVRELIENAIGLVRERELENVKEEATRRVNERLLDLLAPTPSAFEVGVESADSPERYERTREKMRAMLVNGELEQRKVEVAIEQKAHAMMIPGMGPGGEGGGMDIDFQGMLEKILPKNVVRREMTVGEARRVLFDQECEALINAEKVNAKAIELAENTGIIFIDEMDKVVASEGGRGADVSRQGVQRDLLPIVEGTTVQTRYGYIRTDHVLFIAAGAFLGKDDFVRILSEPHNALTRQYAALMKTEGVEVAFGPDAIESLAEYAYRVNQSTQNIGARRLHTIMERLLEELSFEAPDMKMGRVEINAAYVKERLDEIAQDEDLSKFIL
jgi:ATP-dependent HslUV protease ATP-binding subunit HslU